MNFRIISLIALMGASIFLFSGCYHDYPNGYDFSIKAQKDRISRTWQWRKLEYNNLNLTGSYVGWTIDIESGGKVSISDSGQVNVYTGTWDFTARKDNFQLILSDSVMNIPAYQAVEFTITKMSQKEVILDYSGNKASTDEGIKAVQNMSWELKAQ